MAKAVSARSEVAVVLDEDAQLPKEEQTVFKLAVLRRGQFGRVFSTVAPIGERFAREDDSHGDEARKVQRPLSEDFSADDLKALADSADKLYENLSFFLRGWKNFTDDNGVDIKFTFRDPEEENAAPRASDESLDRIDLMQAMELNFKLLEQSSITGRDRKN